MSNHEPSRCAGDGFLPVFGRSAASSKPGERSLDNPSAWDDLKALSGIGALDDLYCPAPDLLEGFLQLGPCEAAIGEDVAQEGYLFAMDFSKFGAPSRS